MKKTILFIFTTLIVGCTNNLEKRSYSELEKMTDWNKAEISNKTALEFKKESEMFKEQKEKDHNVLKNLDVSIDLKNKLFEKWDMLIKITEDMYEYKLIGVVQSQKRRVLIKDIETIKSKINKEIEGIDNGKNNGI